MYRGLCTPYAKTMEFNYFFNIPTHAHTLYTLLKGTKIHIKNT